MDFSGVDWIRMRPVGFSSFHIDVMRQHSSAGWNVAKQAVKTEEQRGYVMLLTDTTGREALLASLSWVTTWRRATWP